MKKESVFSNLFWRFLERCGAQGVTFVVSLVLARMLDTELYGKIALVTVFTTIMQVFVDSGMGNALIQKKDADDLDFSSVFYFNLTVCSVLYLVMFFAAPFIATFYKMPELVPVIRVLSLILIVSGVKNVQQAYVSRNMMFKKFFFSTLGGTIGAAIVGIIMAYLEMGVWALVAQMLLNAVVDTLILWITVKWRPKRMFSFARLKTLFSFGWKLLVSALIDTVFIELRQLIIGRMYTPNDLSFYNKGDQFPRLIVSNINVSIDSVLLPTLSKAQNDPAAVKNMTRRAITVSTFIMMPLMMGLAVCAEPLITLTIGTKWLPCVPFLRVFCITYSFYPIHTANLNAIKAMGRSDLTLKLEICKKLVGLAVLSVSMWFGVKAMAYSLLLTSLINQIINSFPNWKLLNYSYLEQIKDILPQIMASLFMGAIVYLITFLYIPMIVTLLIQVVLGMIVYVAISKIFKIESFEYLLETLKVFLKKKNKTEEQV